MTNKIINNQLSIAPDSVPAQRLMAIYRIESPIGLQRAAELLASEQSIGSFARVPGETDAVIARFGARVERVEELECVASSTLPTSYPGAEGAIRFGRGRVVISFPVTNFGNNVPALAAVLLGNLFELQELTGIRLESVTLPTGYEARFQAPAYGVSGTRRLAGVSEGPVIGTIVKPKLGLAPDEAATLVGQLAEAGVHFIKDDECMTDPPSAPLEERVKKIMPVIERLSDRLGRKVMYAFNITDEPELMRRHHDHVLAHGGTCVMVTVNACGFAATAGLRRHSELPIHAHRAGWGMLTRDPLLGMSFSVFQTLWRLTGIDHLHIGGLDSKFFETNESVVSSGRACLAPLGTHGPIMPVISSGQWGGQAAATLAGIESDDLIYLAGGGLLAHPDGAIWGMRAISDAWDAARAGVPLAEFAQSRPHLQRAIEVFGNRRAMRGSSDA